MVNKGAPIRRTKAYRGRMASKEREAIKEAILQKWGKVYVRKARLRLCPFCARQSNCLLSLVNLDGTDCFYYLREEKV